MGKPKPWPFVYRVTWYNDPDEVADGTRKGSRWTKRATKKEADYWEEAFQRLREYRLGKGTDWNDRLVIERAPVGDWETMYEGEPMSVLQYQQMIGGE